MIRNILTATFRFFLKHKAYSLTNVLGLSIGLATCILIFLFVQDEFRYDRFHEDANLIFRLEPYYLGDGDEGQWAASQGSLIPAVVARYPEVKSGVKFHYSFNTSVFKFGDKSFREPGILFADSTFFDVFSFQLINGDKEHVLSGPGKIVLSEAAASRYFGNDNPVGKLLRSDSRSYMVSGVMQDIPEHSHFHADLIISMDDLRQRWPEADQNGPATFYSYVRLNNDADIENLKSKMRKDVWTLLGYTVGDDESGIPEGYEAEVRLNPITRIHLYGKAEKELESNSDIQNTIIFSAVALLVLIIACINYMNLATARSATRGKEIGVKKVLGANRHIIFNQFMLESFIMGFVALLLSLIMVELILPVFNHMTGKMITLDVFRNVPLLLSLLGIWVFVSFVSGSYPALYLSRFNPLKVLYGNNASSNNGKNTLYFRRVLVVFQFAISVLLIIGVITVYRQLEYIRDRNPGFSKENVVVIPLAGNISADKLEVFKNELRTDPDFISASASNSIPGMRIHILPIRLPDLARNNLQNNDEGDDYVAIRSLSTDLDVMQTFNLEMVAGKGFSTDRPNDAQTGFILNEAAVKEFGLIDPVGKRVEYGWGLEEPIKGHIIGVVKDFNYASLHHEVEPLMIYVDTRLYRYMSVRLSPGHKEGSAAVLEGAWMKAFPGIPFDYFYLDTFYNNMYKAETNIGSVILYFTLLAILIASLGLIGLSAYITEQRTREIGIRKVLGASVSSLVQTFSREFVILVLVANLIAWVPAWIYLGRWLNGFAFSTQLNIWLFLLSGLISLAIALAIVGFQSYRAGNMNPVDAVRAK